MATEKLTTQEKKFTRYYWELHSSHPPRVYHIRYNVSRPSWKQFSRRYSGEKSYIKWRFHREPMLIGVGEYHPVFYHRVLAVLFVVGPYVFSHMARQWQLARILRLSNRDFELFLGWLLEKRGRLDKPIQYIAKMLSTGRATFEHPEYYIKKFNYLITTIEFIAWSHAVLRAYSQLSYDDYIIKPAAWKAQMVLEDPKPETLEELTKTYARRMALQRLRATPQFVKEGKLKYENAEAIAKLLMNALAFLDFKHRLDRSSVEETFSLMLEYYDTHVVYYLPDEEHAKRTYYPPAHSAWRMYKLGKGWTELRQAKIVHPYHPNDLTKPHPFIKQLLDYVGKFEPHLLQKDVFFIHHKLYLAVNGSIFAFVERYNQPVIRMITVKPSSSTGGVG